MAETIVTVPEADAARKNIVPTLLRVSLTVIQPMLLVLISARLVMTPVFLTLEYNRLGFPDDPFGFTREDRLNIAPYALNYLLNGEGISYLGDLRFPDGKMLFNERELQHMVDVKIVTQYAFLSAIIVGIGALAAGLTLWRTSDTRRELRRALQHGSILTLAMVAIIIMLSMLNWDVFFTGFHNLFFAEGTWRFLYSDTLIRLFPEQFWFDAALTIGALTVLGALAMFGVARWWDKKQVN